MDVLTKALLILLTPLLGWVGQRVLRTAKHYFRVTQKTHNPGAVAMELATGVRIREMLDGVITARRVALQAQRSLTTWIRVLVIGLAVDHIVDSYINHHQPFDGEFVLAAVISVLLIVGPERVIVEMRPFLPAEFYRRVLTVAATVMLTVWSMLHVASTNGMGKVLWAGLAWMAVPLGRLAVVGGGKRGRLLAIPGLGLILTGSVVYFGLTTPLTLVIGAGTAVIAAVTIYVAVADE